MKSGRCLGGAAERTASPSLPAPLPPVDMGRTATGGSRLLPGPPARPGLGGPLQHPGRRLWGCPKKPIRATVQSKTRLLMSTDSRDRIHHDPDRQRRHRPDPAAEPLERHRPWTDRRLCRPRGSVGAHRRDPGRRPRRPHHRPDSRRHAHRAGSRPRPGLRRRGALCDPGTGRLPIFSGGRGGLGVLAGPSAGYIIAFPLAAAAAGWLAVVVLRRTAARSGKIRGVSCSPPRW